MFKASSKDLIIKVVSVKERCESCGNAVDMAKCFKKANKHQLRETIED